METFKCRHTVIREGRTNKCANVIAIHTLTLRFVLLKVCKAQVLKKCKAMKGTECKIESNVEAKAMQ